MKIILCLLLSISCARVTKAGRKVYLIESNGTRLDFQNQADQLEARYGCKFLGYIDANTAVFPPTAEHHENEIHAALRNEGAKMGANVVIGNFYVKPATGLGLHCDEEILKKYHHSK